MCSTTRRSAAISPSDAGICGAIVPHKILGRAMPNGSTFDSAVSNQGVPPEESRHEARWARFGTFRRMAQIFA